MYAEWMFRHCSILHNSLIDWPEKGKESEEYFSLSWIVEEGKRKKRKMYCPICKKNVVELAFFDPKGEKSFSPENTCCNNPQCKKEIQERVSGAGYFVALCFSGLDSLPKKIQLAFERVFGELLDWAYLGGNSTKQVFIAFFMEE
jgi:hypothetical protein